MELKEIMQMAKNGNREEMEALPKSQLVNAIIKLTKRYDWEKHNSPHCQELEIIAELHKALINKADIGIFNSQIHELERQLTATEEEREALQEANRELEDELQQLRGRVCELEQKLASASRVGRPEKYDKDFRARVKAYYQEDHTYKETAREFKISTNTVGRILKE